MHDSFIIPVGTQVVLRYAHEVLFLMGQVSHTRFRGPHIRSLALLLVVTGSASASEWEKLPSLPDKEGFAGPFAGVSNGAMVVAGGANFPDRRPWEGGKKVWYDTVFVLDKPEGKWQVAGKLPRPLGYGVSVSHGDGVVCVGGSDAEKHHAEAIRLDWIDGKLHVTELPALPKSVANACGALVSDTLFVIGGQEKPDSVALKSGWRIDLSAKQPRWTEIDPLPCGGRMLAMAAGFDGALWVAGGAELVEGKGGKLEREFRKDAYRFDLTSGWKRVADLPTALAAAPSPCPTDATGFFVLGGDDEKRFYSVPEKHPGFNTAVLHYNAKTDKWTAAGEWATPRAVVPVVRWADRWVIPSGEVRAGVRSPDVWGFTPKR